MKNRGLGKGLSALISQQGIINDTASNEGVIAKLEINQIETGRFQPRKVFNEELIAELADSIKRHGIIQPLVVRKNKDNSKYEIIAGERRWRAAKLAGFTEVPVVIKEMDDASVAEQSLIENIQRADLNPLEEAEAYLELMNNFGYTQEKLSEAVGKKRGHIANMVRVSLLPQEVKSYILNNQISFSHIKVIAAHDDVAEIAKEVVDKNLSVRQTERLLKKWEKISINKNRYEKKRRAAGSEDDFDAIAQSLTEKLGLKVEISFVGTRGKVTIHYHNYHQLDSLLEKLG